MTTATMATTDAATSHDDRLHILLYTAVNETEFTDCLKAAGHKTLIAAKQQMEESPNFTKLRKKLIANRLDDLHNMAASEAAAGSVVTIDTTASPVPDPKPAAEPKPAKAKAKRSSKKKSVEPETAAEPTTADEPVVDDRIVPASIAAPPVPQGFKCFVDRSTFAKFLPAMKRLVGNPSHEILANVLMEVKTESIVLTAFNLSSALRITIAADVERSGVFTLPCALLADLFSKLPDEVITFEHDLDEAAVWVYSSVGKHRLVGMDADQFPALPVFKGTALAMPMELLLDSIHYCEFSAATDPTKQVLCGLHMTLDDGTFGVASTDGHRLSVYDQNISDVEFKRTEFTLPTSALADLKQLAPSTATVQVTFDDDVTPVDQLVGSAFIQFQSGGNLLICRLIEGQYPNYRQLIPRQFSKLAVMDCKALAAAVDRVALFAVGDIISLEFLHLTGQVKVLAEGAHGEGDEYLPCSGDWFKSMKATEKPFKISFNAGYLAQLMRVLPGDDVQLNMNTATSPALVCADSFTHLLMPVQVR